jgi:hypothetical protein
MYYLAKLGLLSPIGFSRGGNTKSEFEQYFMGRHLISVCASSSGQPWFANTPGILHAYLQTRRTSLRVKTS